MLKPKLQNNEQGNAAMHVLRTSNFDMKNPKLPNQRSAELRNEFLQRIYVQVRRYVKKKKIYWQPIRNLKAKQKVTHYVATIPGSGMKIL